jgi:hypothetical protein
MNHSPSEQSPSDRSTDAGCSQSQVIDLEDGIQTSFAALCDLQTDHLRKLNTKILASRCEEEMPLSMLLILVTETQVVKELAENSKTDDAVDLSRETVPLPPVAIPSVQSHDNQTVLGASKLKIKFFI